jgi:6-phosphogluconolactonase
MSERRARRVVTSDLAGAVAERIAATVRLGGHIALTGGNTPRAAYERLAGMHLQWSRCTLWFGDERCVPPDDEHSNFGMVRAALLNRLPAPGPRVERMKGELGPQEGAADYEALLAREFGPVLPPFDLVLLGIGPDGHCASLFPGAPELAEEERPVVGVERAGLEPFVPRVSLTMPAINAGRSVVFVAGGAEKADALARAIAGDRDVPAGLVRPQSKDLTFMLDEAAAGGART